MNEDLLLIVVREALLPLVVLVLTPLLVALANRAVLVLKQKLDVELSDQQQAQIDKIVRESIHFAEEQGRKALKNAEDDEVLSGEQKLEAAIEYAKKRGKHMNLDDVLDDLSNDLADLIEAKLAEKRTEAEE